MINEYTVPGIPAFYLGVDDDGLLDALAARNPEAAALGEYGSYATGLAGLVKGVERKAFVEGAELLADSVSVRIATEGSAVAARGESALLGQIREAGGTLAVGRGQFGVQDIAAASRAGGNEIAFFRDRATRQLYLRELGPQMGDIPLDSRLILHTQPGSMATSVTPSVLDRAALSSLGQRSSVIINFDGTYAIRFRSNNVSDGPITWIGN